MNLLFKFFALLLIVAAESTLSKSNSKKHNKRNEKKEQVTFKSIVSHDYNSEDASIDETEILDSIRNTHNKLNINDREYDGITLAYVTPWNNHGYDVVKWAAKKFTHISPVWFNVQLFTTKTGEATFQIGGKQDIDMGWMDDIRENNTDIKFLPRFLFNEFTKESLEIFLYSETFQQQLFNEIVDFIKSHEFDGAVIEMWTQIMGRTKGTAETFLIEALENFGRKLREENLLSVLPLTPPLDSQLNKIGLVSKDTLTRFGKAVDYINLMAYDYSSDANFSPVAPFYWIEANLDALFDANIPVEKILLGLNWYGYQYSLDGEHQKSILGRDFLNLIDNDDIKFVYDEHIKEHQVILWNKRIVAYYPTLKSLSERIKYAKNLRLSGIAIWDVGQGLDHFTSIL